MLFALVIPFLQTEAIESYTSQVKLVEHRLRLARESHGRARMDSIMEAGSVFLGCTPCYYARAHLHLAIALKANMTQANIPVRV